MKRSELVRQLNLLPDVEVKMLVESDMGDVSSNDFSFIYMSNNNEIIISEYDYSHLKFKDRPKSNKFE